MKDENIQDVIFQSQSLIESLEVYKQEHGKYPSTLHILIPDYIKVIPEITNAFYFRKIYYYTEAKLNSSIENSYGLHIRKKHLPLPGDRESQVLKYYSSQIYENTEYRVLHKVVDGWAAYTNYRNYNPDLSSNSQVTSENRKVENN